MVRSELNLLLAFFFPAPTYPQSQDLPVPALEMGGRSPPPLLLQGTQEQSKQSQFLEMDKDMKMIQWPGK